MRVLGVRPSDTFLCIDRGDFGRSWCFVLGLGISFDLYRVRAVGGGFLRGGLGVGADGFWVKRRGRSMAVLVGVGFCFLRFGGVLSPSESSSLFVGGA